MAATGFTPISLYYSTTASAVPSAGNLVNGELALNTADMKLYAKNSSGAVTLLASSGGAAGTVSSVAQSFTGGLISVSGSPITTSGTLALTVAGTSGGIPYFSSASTWASSGVLAANSLVLGGGAGVAPLTTTTGTGVVTALGVNVGSAGAFVVNGGALGTPSSGTVTNLTGTASININGTVGATTANTGAFTTLSASSTVTLSGGTANGVTYLNGSKVLTSGSALTYNGTTLGIKSAPLTGWLYSGMAIGDGTGDNGITLHSSSVSGYGAIAFADGTTGSQTYSGLIQYYHANDSMQFYTAGSEQMRLTSTGLGIGTTTPATGTAAYPGSWQPAFQVYGGSNAVGIIRSGTGDARLNLVSGGAATNQKNWFIDATTAGSLAIATGLDTLGGTTRLTIDSSGNLGLGATPKAWGGNFTAIQVNNLTAVSYNNNNGNSQYSNNVFWNSSNTATYVNTSAASFYQQQYATGAHAWYTAASGTANTAISFTQAMTLDASGNLLVGGTSNAVGARAILENSAGNQLGLRYTSVATYYNSVDSSGNLIWTKDGTERARISSTGGFSVGTTADPGAGAIYATGAITAYYSDERLKDVKGRIQNALAKVRRLSGVYYTNNETAKALGYTSDEMQVGVLANQMKGELPEIVKPAPFDLDENGNSKSGQNYMTVQYERGLPLLIEAIKELADQFDDYVATH